MMDKERISIITQQLKMLRARLGTEAYVAARTDPAHARELRQIQESVDESLAALGDETASKWKVESFVKPRHEATVTLVLPQLSYIDRGGNRIETPPGCALELRFSRSQIQMMLEVAK